MRPMPPELTPRLTRQDTWLGVYDAAVEAIFLCYLVDQEENDGEVRPYYASATLRSYMERHRPCYQLPETSPPGSSNASQDARHDSKSAQGRGLSHDSKPA
jgi:hypothetical protein